MWYTFTDKKQKNFEWYYYPDVAGGPKIVQVVNLVTFYTFKDCKFDSKPKKSWWFKLSLSPNSKTVFPPLEVKVLFFYFEKSRNPLEIQEIFLKIEEPPKGLKYFLALTYVFEIIPGAPPLKLRSPCPNNLKPRTTPQVIFVDFSAGCWASGGGEDYTVEKQFNRLLKYFFELI